LFSSFRVKLKIGVTGRPAKRNFLRFIAAHTSRVPKNGAVKIGFSSLDFLYASGRRCC
jgi:hypothetical protein